MDGTCKNSCLKGVNTVFDETTKMFPVGVYYTHIDTLARRCNRWRRYVIRKSVSHFLVLLFKCVYECVSVSQHKNMKKNAIIVLIFQQREWTQSVAWKCRIMLFCLYIVVLWIRMFETYVYTDSLPIPLCCARAHIFHLHIFNVPCMCKIYVLHDS